MMVLVERPTHMKVEEIDLQEMEIHRRVKEQAFHTTQTRMLVLD